MFNIVSTSIPSATQNGYFRFSKWCFGFIFPSFYFPLPSICISLLFSHSVISDSLQPHVLHSTRQTSLSFTISQSLLKFKFIELVMPSNHLIFCRPLLLSLSIFPSIRVFSKESALHIRWPKDWSFSISPSNEYSGLTAFRIDWSDFSVQGALKSLLQTTPQFGSFNSWVFRLASVSMC